MKLSKWARKEGISYTTAWRMWHSGKLNAHQLPTGTVIVETDDPVPDAVSIYARVSSSENRSNLDAQATRLEQYAIARGYRIHAIVKEVGSGVNDQRKKLKHLLADRGYHTLIVEHKDRFTRFGFEYISDWMNSTGRKVEVVNEAADGKEDLMQDLISIVTSMCARYYGLRRSHRKTEAIIRELQKDD